MTILMGIWRIGKNDYIYDLSCIVSSFVLGRICCNRRIVKSLSVAVYPSADRSGIVRAGSGSLLYPDSDTSGGEGFYGWYSCDSAGIDTRGEIMYCLYYTVVPDMRSFSLNMTSFVTGGIEKFGESPVQ